MEYFNINDLRNIVIRETKKAGITLYDGRRDRGYQLLTEPTELLVCKCYLSVTGALGFFVTTITRQWEFDKALEAGLTPDLDQIYVTAYMGRFNAIAENIAEAVEQSPDLDYEVTLCSRS